MIRVGVGIGHGGTVLLGIALGTALGAFFTDATWKLLARPFHPPGTAQGDTQYTSLLDSAPEAFLSQLKLSLILGLGLTSPIWLYELFAMIAPRLHGSGRRWTGIFLAGAIPLFGIGGIVAILTLRHGLWLSDYGSGTVITASDYIDQTMARLLILGAAVELPLLAAVIILERRRSRRP